MSTELRRRWQALGNASVIALSASFALVFLADMIFDLGVNDRCAFTPMELTAAIDTLRNDPGSFEAWWVVSSLWTPVFAHASLEHLGHNLLFFWLFGSLLTQVANNRWLLFAFFVTAATASLAFYLRHPDGPTGMVGASGAISGVAGAYVILALRWNAPSAHAWPLAYPVAPAHAALVAIIAAGADVFALSTERYGGGDNVAYEAHIGGFAGGLVISLALTTVFPTIERFRRSWLGRPLF
jgi:membrane associated rhomboid family serine protease